MLAIKLKSFLSFFIYILIQNIYIYILIKYIYSCCTKNLLIPKRPRVGLHDTQAQSQLRSKTKEVKDLSVPVEPGEGLTRPGTDQPSHRPTNLVRTEPFPSRMDQERTWSCPDPSFINHFGSPRKGQRYSTFSHLSLFKALNDLL